MSPEDRRSRFQTETQRPLTAPGCGDAKGRRVFVTILKALFPRPANKLVKPRQKFSEKFCENHKISLDIGPLSCYIVGARVRRHVRTARKREIARRRGNFRGVCPVPAKPVRNRAAETSPIHAYIARRGVRTGQKSRFVFRTRPDTHGCVYTGNKRFHPYA